MNLHARTAAHSSLGYHALVGERLYLRLDGDPLYAPETTVPAGAMVELPIAEALRDHVSHIAACLEVFPEGTEVHERVIPDGAVRIMFHLGDPPSAEVALGPSAVVVGAAASPVALRLRGRLEGVTVTLRPGAVADVLGAPASAIAGRAVELDALWPGAVAELLGRIATTSDAAARLSIVSDALERRVRDAGDERRRARTAVQLFLASGGGRTVREVADAIGVGERRLQQLFHAQVGLTPRAFRRLARLHACVRALRAIDTPSWAQVAAQVGFYDQAHLVNEFRALSGLTPAAFFARTVSGSSKTPA